MNRFTLSFSLTGIAMLNPPTMEFWSEREVRMVATALMEYAERHPAGSSGAAMTTTFENIVVKKHIHEVITEHYPPEEP